MLHLDLLLSLRVSNVLLLLQCLLISLAGLSTLILPMLEPFLLFLMLNPGVLIEHDTLELPFPPGLVFLVSHRGGVLLNENIPLCLVKEFVLRLQIPPVLQLLPVELL